MILWFQTFRGGFRTAAARQVAPSEACPSIRLWSRQYNSGNRCRRKFSI